MSDRKIFVNLPVSDLATSEAFFEALGATRNPMFSDDNASCMVVSDTIHFMLLTHDKYRKFTSLPIGDAKATSSALIALSLDARDDVDRLLAAAVAAGGTADPGPVQDHGFMYGRSVADPDGHHLELFWMDPAAVGAAPADTVEA